MEKTVIYSDELNDDFATTVEPDKIKPLPENYKYVTKNIFGKALNFIAYRLLMRPFSWLYIKIAFHHRFVNAGILKKRKTGMFIYANHTLVAGDAFIPNAIPKGRYNYIMTGEQANSLTAILPVMRAVGNIPLTTSVRQNVKMMRCIKQRIAEKATITIYPESHVWPYYTGVRPFPSTSFKYAVMMGAPVVCMTNCYVKRKHGKKPKVITYLDGPFYPKEELSVNENAEYLRDAVYRCMVERAREHSTYSYYTYIKVEEQSDCFEEKNLIEVV